MDEKNLIVDVTNKVTSIIYCSKYNSKRLSNIVQRFDSIRNSKVIAFEIYRTILIQRKI